MQHNNSSELWIPEDIEDYFARSPIGTMTEVGNIERDASHPLSARMSEVFSRLPNDILARIASSPDFLALHDRADGDLDWLAREWAIVEELDARISARRHGALLSAQPRPTPYDHAALVDLKVSEDLLVPLSEFDVEEGVLSRNGHAFVVLLPAPSPNSYYWLTQALCRNRIADDVYVRLDPLITGDLSTFPVMFYRMLWWGQPVDWSELLAAKGEICGRWAPGLLGARSEFTDYAWSPRDDEQHLFIEELPKREDVSTSWSRYLHAIFHRPSGAVTHFDGAIRIYSKPEWDTRLSSHVHRAGKVGRRLKVFRVDGEIDPSAICPIGGAFYVWNYDVARFFGMPVPDALLGGVA